MALHKRLKYYRTKNGLTQESVANVLEIKTSNYAKYESGERNPKSDRIAQLSKILDTSYSNLIYGEESIAIDLLNSHIRGAAIGDIDGFYSFYEVFDDGVLCEVRNYLVGWNDVIKRYFGDLHTELLEDCTLHSIAELNNRYKQSLGNFNQFHYRANNKEPEQLVDEHMLGHENLTDDTIYKVAFCVAVANYIDLSGVSGSFSVDFILPDMREYLGNKDLSDESTLQSFAILVLIPFLSHILDTLEFIKANNSNINDFANYFLYQALTPQQTDDDWTGLN